MTMQHITSTTTGAGYTVMLAHYPETNTWKILHSFDVTWPDGFKGSVGSQAGPYPECDYASWAYQAIVDRYRASR